MPNDNTTGGPKRTPKVLTEDEINARRAAKQVSPLQYWDTYVDYASSHKEDPSQWNRDKFLAHIKQVHDLPHLPSGSAISGKHVYVTGTLLPELSKDNTSPWFGITAAQLDRADLPPTSRDTKEAWAKNAELANKTKFLFGDD